MTTASWCAAPRAAAASAATTSRKTCGPFRAIPLALKGGPQAASRFRGEVYLPKKNFERINKEQEEAGEPLYANPRNTAAGTMRNLDPALVAKRGFVRLDVPACRRV
jgi:NAD-dependent DNA ligase